MTSSSYEELVTVPVHEPAARAEADRPREPLATVGGRRAHRRAPVLRGVEGPVPRGAAASRRGRLLPPARRRRVLRRRSGHRQPAGRRAPVPPAPEGPGVAPEVPHQHPGRNAGRGRRHVDAPHSPGSRPSASVARLPAGDRQSRPRRRPVVHAAARRPPRAPPHAPRAPAGVVGGRRRLDRTAALVRRPRAGGPVRGRRPARRARIRAGGAVRGRTGRALGLLGGSAGDVVRSGAAAAVRARAARRRCRRRWGRRRHHVVAGDVRGRQPPQRHPVRRVHRREPRLPRTSTSSGTSHRRAGRWWRRRRR